MRCPKCPGTRQAAEAFLQRAWRNSDLGIWPPCRRLVNIWKILSCILSRSPIPRATVCLTVSVGYDSSDAVVRGIGICGHTKKGLRMAEP
jgi:hypothetical protein